jgi:hypothetical protein
MQRCGIGGEGETGAFKCLTPSALRPAPDAGPFFESHTAKYQPDRKRGRAGSITKWSIARGGAEGARTSNLNLLRAPGDRWWWGRL